MTPDREFLASFGFDEAVNSVVGLFHLPFFHSQAIDFDAYFYIAEQSVKASAPDQARH